MRRLLHSIAATTAALLCVHALARAEDPDASAAKPHAKTAKELIQKQEPFRVVEDLYAKATPESTRIVVNLATQRLLLLVGDETCIETPISSGKSAAPTPVGTFTIQEKIKTHMSSTYGNFVDKRGRVVRSGVSMKLDVAPPGTRFLAAPMACFLRFTDTGFGIHGGILPGYPATQVSIRVPEEIAQLIFEKVRVGTPIEIRAE